MSVDDLELATYELSMLALEELDFMGEEFRNVPENRHKLVETDMRYDEELKWFRDKYSEDCWKIVSDASIRYVDAQFCPTFVG